MLYYCLFNYSFRHGINFWTIWKKFISNLICLENMFNYINTVFLYYLSRRSLILNLCILIKICAKPGSERENLFYIFGQQVKFLRKLLTCFVGCTARIRCKAFKYIIYSQSECIQIQSIFTFHISPSMRRSSWHTHAYINAPILGTYDYVNRVHWLRSCK